MNTIENSGKGLCGNIIPIPESKKVKPLHWKVARLGELFRKKNDYTAQRDYLISVNSSFDSKKTQEVCEKLSEVNAQFRG